MKHETEGTLLTFHSPDINHKKAVCKISFKTFYHRGHKQKRHLHSHNSSETAQHYKTMR